MITLNQQLLGSGKDGKDDTVLPINDEHIHFYQHPAYYQYWRSALRHGGGRMHLQTSDDSPLLLHVQRVGRGTVLHFSLNGAAAYYHGFAADAVSAELVWQEMMSLWEEFGIASEQPKLIAKLPWVVTFAAASYPQDGELHEFHYYERLLLFLLARDAGVGQESHPPALPVSLPNDILLTWQDWDSGLTERCQETEWPVPPNDWPMLLKVLRQGETCPAGTLPDKPVVLVDGGAKIKLSKNDNRNETVYVALTAAAADRLWPEIEAAHARWQQHNPEEPSLRRPSTPWLVTHSSDCQRRPNLPMVPKYQLYLAFILAHLQRGEIPQETP